MNFARTNPVTVVAVKPVPDTDQHMVTFYFCDGLHCDTIWSSYGVLADWLNARRSWDSLDRISFKGSDADFLQFRDRFRRGKGRHSQSVFLHHRR